MHTLRKQCTIAKQTTVEGFGYWSGRDVKVEFRPAAPDTGVAFVRGDLATPVRIPATVAHRIEMPLRTTLAKNGVRVEMVEHIMAALYGMQIDNCEVWVDQPEMPGMDGSSLAFVEALNKVGIVHQAESRNQLIICETTRLGDDESWIEARPVTHGGLTIRYRLDYGNGNAIGRQTWETPVTPNAFRHELAPCRTFMFKQEADWLLSQGLGTRATTSDLLVFGDLGPIDNELRFSDECVRHKMLDLVGDLALAGCDIVGHIMAHRTGHRLNAELVRVLLSEGEMIQARRRSA